MTEVKNPSVYVGGVKVVECQVADIEFDSALPAMNLGVMGGAIKDPGPLLGYTRSGEIVTWRKSVHLTGEGDKLTVGKAFRMSASNGTSCRYRVTKITRQTDSETEFDAERVDDES